MARHKETTAEILAGWNEPEPCDIACRLCGVKVRDDKPDAVWQGFKPGLGTNAFAIDEHEACDAIAKEMEKPSFNGDLDAFLGRLNIDVSDPARVRRVLSWKLGHRWELGAVARR